MDENPYSPPKVESALPERPRMGWISYLVSTVLLGALGGEVVLFVVNYLFIVSIWKPLPPKGDPRWDVLVFVASTALPIAIGIGVLFAAVVLYSRTVPMRTSWMMACCCVIIVLAWILRPGIARLFDAPPVMWEIVPDTIARCAEIAMLMIAGHGLWGVIRSSFRKITSGNAGLGERSRETTDSDPKRGSRQD